MECFACAETIADGAPRCPLCGELQGLEGARALRAPAPARGHDGASIVVAGVLGLGLALALTMKAPLSRVDRNEQGAAQNLSQLVTAQTSALKGQPPAYGTLAQLGAAQLVDGVLAMGRKSGYVFVCEVRPDPTAGWAATASPAAPGATGTRWFGVDATGQVLESSTAPFTCEGGVLVSPPDARPVR